MLDDLTAGVATAADLPLLLIWDGRIEVERWTGMGVGGDGSASTRKESGRSGRRLTGSWLPRLCDSTSCWPPPPPGRRGMEENKISRVPACSSGSYNEERH